MESKTHDFTKKAKAVHGDFYDYRQVKYTNNRTVVEIICPIHGVFSQTPSNHLRYGCNQCAYKTRATKQTKTTPQFVLEAQNVHGKKYSYSKVDYKQAHVLVEISCPIHGSFLQTPNSHLRGRGCPQCKQGKGHPMYGKPAPSSGYFGWYKKEDIFRSLPELFWILESRKQSRPYVNLDKKGNRTNWQVEVVLNGKFATYCADFFLPKENKIIDIKPKWRSRLQSEKLAQAKLAYEKRGYEFEILDSDSIQVRVGDFKKLVESGEVILYPSAQKRFNKRFGS